MNKKGTKVKVKELPKCDFCKGIGVLSKAKYDGKTIHGSWAYMCQTHYDERGVGLGLGRGQELIVMESE